MSNINTARARAIVRDWARENDIAVSDKGAVSAVVRQAWVNAHAPSRQAVVLEVGDHSWKVMCPLCANEHEHGTEEGHRVAHCWDPLADTSHGYEIVISGPVVDERTTAL